VWPLWPRLRTLALYNCDLSSERLWWPSLGPCGLPKLDLEKPYGVTTHDEIQIPRLKNCYPLLVVKHRELLRSCSSNNCRVTWSWQSTDPKLTTEDPGPPYTIFFFWRPRPTLTSYMLAEKERLHLALVTIDQSKPSPLINPCT
jgi:hypothetical protein